ncbi:MAG: hypothetical protein ACXIUW_13770 [Roseinatronobacter sp.]
MAAVIKELGGQVEVMKLAMKPASPCRSGKWGARSGWDRRVIRLRLLSHGMSSDWFWPGGWRGLLTPAGAKDMARCDLVDVLPL